MQSLRITFKSSDFSGKCTDFVLWSINDHADDADSFFAVRNTHSAYNVLVRNHEAFDLISLELSLSSTIIEITATLVFHDFTFSC